MRRRPSQILVHLLLLGVGLLFALLACEILLRLASWFVPPHKAADARPPFYYKQAGSPSFQNFRDAVPKPPGVFRAAAIGDSFTYPHYLQFDDAYPQKLANIMNLARTSDAAPRAEVINYGAAGYSTEMELATFQRALDEGAELLILEITLNDPAADNTISEFQRRAPGRYGRLEISAERTPLLHYVKTFGFLAERWHNLQTHDSYVRYHRALFDNPDTWASFSRAVLEMQRRSRERGAVFVAFTFPIFAFPLDKSYPLRGVHRKIAAFMREHEIPHLDLLPAYLRVPPERLHVFAVGNSHPNEIAHRIAAEYLYLWLEDLELIPEELRLADKFRTRFPPRRLTKKQVRRMRVFTAEREAQKKHPKREDDGS